jgi:hypothetical protein
MPARLRQNQCRVCLHDRCTEIDQVLADGHALRRVAQQYGVHYASLHRHRVHGRLQSVRQETVMRQREAARRLLDRARSLNERALGGNGSHLETVLLVRESTRLLVALAEALAGTERP